MALKFRRGTTAQQSGSLAFGEPFVNTTLGTLIVGGDAGDIILSAANGSGVVSGSSQITLQSTTGFTAYNTAISTITGSLISSASANTIAVSNLNSFTSSINTTIKSKLDTDGVVSGSSQLTASYDTRYGLSGSVLLNSQTSSMTAGFSTYASNVAVTSTGTTTDSTLYPVFTVNSASNGYVGLRNHLSGSYYFDGVTRKLYAETIVGSIEATNNVVSGSSQVTLQSTTGFSSYDSVLATITGSLITSASTAKTTNDSQGVSITNLNTYTGSLNTAIQLTGSTVSFLGNIVVYGTQSVINSQNVQIADNILYLSPTSSVDNDLGIVGHYNDGTYKHAGIFMDASDGHAWKIFNGLQDETSAQIDTAGTGFTLADFKAGAITGTSFSGNILSTNGVVSGSSQIQLGSASGNIALATQTTGDYVASLVAGTNITLTNNSGENATPTIGLTNNAITIAGVSTSLGGTISAATIGNAIGAFSGSAQVSGLSNAQLTNSTISGISLGSNLAALTIGTGLSGTSYNGSTGVTIANTGVTSNVAGTGVTVSGATGAVTISIGQSVATTATPTFGNLTINGTITATGDITAYYTSDRRHKNNIQTISNAVLKVKQLNGVTWEWNDDVNEVTKSTPKTGLIAQEVQAVLPQVVTERADGFLALDYSKMVGLLVEAIKEQQIQIDQLKAQIGSK